ncbi:hypothetical protein SCARR_03363 [Pontiella sulfatireligans]|uniref:Glycosyltransferase 2-like domain-containing protein n=2 Tax=Pontiella sulfatireligans TaxID=2750658 RepID=A0A6C2UPU1_9BACT|nr:hypothetical protein SCARR_03363 [Pontiella sulfatireligans]
MPSAVAIIMRSKNEMPHVRRALAMLTQQTFREFKLYAIDSGSTDGTLESLRKHGVDVVQITPEEYVPGRVLNDAIARAKHQIIVLLNADAVPLSHDWLEKLLLPITENRADAAFSKQIARPDAHFIVAYDYERAYNSNKADPCFFSAVACAFRRELWEMVRFREHGYAEDAAWAAECATGGARLQLAEDSTVEHSHNYTLTALSQKRLRQALTFDQAPSAGRQTWRCVREIVRDLLHAGAKLKPHTIPYNIAYRITIHRALQRGLKERRKESAR